MNGEGLIERLKGLKYYELIFTQHAELRLVMRQIDKGIVIAHLREPDSLKLVEKLPHRKDDEKYKLWFVPFKRIAYIYVIVINHLQKRIVVKTVVKQRLDWQKRVEKHVK